MNQGKDRKFNEFDKCVKRYNGNRHAIEFKMQARIKRSIDATLVALVLQVACPESNISNARLWHISTGHKGLAHLSRFSVRY